MRGLFVTGTDTGVGKTFVTGGLARLLCSRGLRVGVMKPIETGCARHGDDLVPSDAWQLMTAAGGQQDLSSVCPYRFEAALAPDVTARLEGCTIEPEVIQSRFQAIASSHDVVLVEGAGGLLVPIRGRYTMADLAVDLGLPMLVVTASRLGRRQPHPVDTRACAVSRPHGRRICLEPAEPGDRRRDVDERRPAGEVDRCAMCWRDRVDAVRP